jgi:uncharacterized protein (DUF1800 family)
MAERADIIHLLRRTEFVARPDRIDDLVSLTYDAAVDDVLSVTPSDVEVAIPPGLDEHLDGGANWPQYQAAVHWWFERMVRHSARPVQERMTFFWHGHFCSEWSKVFDTRAMLRQNALFRRHALGNVRDLAQAMSVQPAMLRYLDNAQNTRHSPNQNFARELLELFVLGVGNYTESDVEAATAAWTGHNIERSTGEYVFRADRHDDGTKTFLGQTGPWDGPDIIDIVLGFRPGVEAVVAVGPNAGLPTKVVAARFLSRKLWEAFASERPAAEIVASLAQVLVENDFEIRPWVAAMLRHPAFRTDAVRRGLVRTPTDYIVAVLYSTGLSASAVNPEWFAGDMGQAMFRPPNVSGWRVNGYWVNTSAIAARAAFANHVRWKLTSGRSDTSSLVLRSGSWRWTADLDAMTPEHLVDTLSAAFELELSTTSRNALVTWAAGEQRAWGPDWWRSPNALLLTMITPEMSVA